MNKLNKIKELFLLLKEGHNVYVKASAPTQRELAESFDFYFQELEELGVAREFSEALFFFGKEFLDFEYPEVKKNEVEPQSSQEQQTQQTLDGSPGEPIQRGTSQEEDDSRPATIEDAERIFGVKATPMDDKAIREAKLAERGGALVYTSLPMQGDKVGIDVLLYKKGFGPNAKKA